MMMLTEAEPSEVHNMPAAEGAAHYAFLSDVVAQKNLSWKRFLEPNGEHRQDVGRVVCRTAGAGTSGRWCRLRRRFGRPHLCCLILKVMWTACVHCR